MSRSLPAKSDKFCCMLSIFLCPCMLYRLSMKGLPSSEKMIDHANKLITYLANTVMKSTSSLWLIEYPWFGHAQYFPLDHRAWLSIIYLQHQSPYAKFKLSVIRKRIWIWMLLIIITVKDCDSSSLIQYCSLGEQ